MHKHKRLIWLLVTLALAPLSAAAQDEPWTINLMIENDSFFHIADRHYTNGMYVSATSNSDPDCATCRYLADHLMNENPDPEKTYRFGGFAGQSMFTPEDLSLNPPDPRDRPYGGWVYVGARLYRETENVLDRAEANIGWVGPGSGADAVQRWWHALHWFGGVPPKGWHDQIKDEPGVELSEQRIWRRWSPIGPFEAEVLPEANVSLGNVLTYAAAGAALRFGQRLHADWGAPRIPPALSGSDFIAYDRVKPFAWYGYIGFEGRAVVRNIFLDGSSFQHSANVEKKPLVADLVVGAAVLSRYVSFYASYTVRSREFKTQNGDDAFFSFTLTVPAG